MTEQGYYRHPTLFEDHVVFVCEDNLWTVPASAAWRGSSPATPVASLPRLFHRTGRCSLFQGATRVQTMFTSCE